MRKSIGAAVVLVVFLGVLAVAPSASATALCKKAGESVCSVENTYDTGTILKLKSTNFTLTSNISTVTCGESNSEIEITDPGGSGAVKGSVNSLTFGGECKTGGGTACTVVNAVNLPYEFSIEGATATVADPVGAGEEIKCGFLMQCTFTSKDSTFAFNGGSPATMTAIEVSVSRAGGICPATANWHAVYSVTSPESVFVSSSSQPQAKLCQESTSPCPGSKRYSIGTTIEGALEGNSVFEFLYEGKPSEPWCEGATLTGKTTTAGKPLIGEVSAMMFKKCGAGVCAVEAQSRPYKAEIENTSGGNGTMALGTGGSGVPKLEVNCGKSFKCIYKAASVSFTVTGGNPAKIAVSKTMERDAASEAECGATMIWTATYELTKPAPMFVVS